MRQSRSFTLVLLSLFLSSNLSWAQTKDYKGFFDYSINEKNGKVLLKVSEFGKEFILVHYLSQGVGSNDLGLDRGKIGDTRIVKFERYGDKILLVQPNYEYRAISKNPEEVKAVKEAFAKSVIYGFKIDTIKGKDYYIDISPMLQEDLNDIVGNLKQNKQGTYKLEKTRTTVVYDECLAFPNNIEFEALVTLTGEATGRFIKSVTPSADAVTIGQHVSMVALPDDGYKPRKLHTYSGYFGTSFFDYATPINEPISVKYINRHRLQKKNPNAAKSEPIEPIIYYIDRGCPEPVKSALMEGASWWNEAFEAAGFINAFQVKELPEGAHPLDTRYNMIQWVHRSTRGWSYGASVTDPRTGEIIKGHVSLGSLRVRQDFMIAQGLLSPYASGDDNDATMIKMSLARLRQLAAHEVGHTIGLAHNFAASANNDASVMDYPHPKITLKDGKLDFESAYDVGIGAWDKRAIIYGYTELAGDENAQLNNIIKQTQEMGLLYLSDPDSRPDESASSLGHLWDNGKNAIDELVRLKEIRKYSLNLFGKNTIKNGTPYSELEKVLVPLYYLHRYQAEAVSKFIGGYDYTYAVKGDTHKDGIKQVSLLEQNKAKAQLLSLISDDYLNLPSSITAWILPTAYGYNKTAENFVNKTNYGFDPYAAKESAIAHLLDLMLAPTRLNRVLNQDGLELTKYLNLINTNLKSKITKDEGSSGNIGYKLYIQKLANLTLNENLNDGAKSIVMAAIYNEAKPSSLRLTPSGIFAADVILKVKDGNWTAKASSSQIIPPGAPIGCDGTGHMH